MTDTVAVLMAAYNAEKTLRDSVASVLRSTHPFRLYIVDDCSRVPVAEVLGDYDRDRIDITRLANNAGPAGARNAGLRKILKDGHALVAIMDADDICYPDRLAKQAAYLAAHSDVAVVGSWERIIDENSKFVSDVALPCDPAEIRDLLYVKMCVSHPALMIRSDVFRQLGLYSERYRAGEDYELVRRIAAHHDIANLPEYLLDYRISPGGMSMSNRKRQLVDRLRVQLTYFSPLRWRAWVGIARTIALLIVPAKRTKPDTISPERAKALQAT
jgi:glycosyltransferase involved in cell wall biosynthesis